MSSSQSVALIIVIVALYAAWLNSQGRLVPVLYAFGGAKPPVQANVSSSGLQQTVTSVTGSINGLTSAINAINQSLTNTFGNKTPPAVQTGNNIGQQISNQINNATAQAIGQVGTQSGASTQSILQWAGQIGSWLGSFGL